MMQIDQNNLAVSLHSDRAVAAWNAVQRAFLAHGQATPAVLGDLLAAAPGFAAGHAAKGLFLILLGRSELWPAAALALAAAERGEADRREDLYVAALRAALGGRLRQAAQILDGLLDLWPTDALAMKLVHALRFMLGDARGMRASLERIAPHWAEHPLRGYFLGCRAFAAEEAGEYAAAERLGREGLELAQDDAWGLHAVAHVHDMTGRPAEGVRWLVGRTTQWAHCNNFGYHVWWHLALFHLERGAFGPALDLYDLRVRPVHTDDYRDIANAASLLLRLELEGVDVGGRWEELAALAGGRVQDGALVFADLHYQLALIHAGRAGAAEALADRLARDAGGAWLHDQHEVAAVVGHAMARGLIAFRDAAYDAALADLRRGLANLARIGGSHAQRDVFQRIAVEAALRAGDEAAAIELLAARRAARGAEDGYFGRCMARIEARRAALAAGYAAE
jgi:hypothetical protein